MLCLVTATECFVCELQPQGFNLLSADTRIRRDGPGRHRKAAGSQAVSWGHELGAPPLSLFMEEGAWPGFLPAPRPPESPLWD